jgi:hypothetical protein
MNDTTFPPIPHLDATHNAGLLALLQAGASGLTTDQLQDKLRPTPVHGVLEKLMGLDMVAHPREQLRNRQQQIVEKVHEERYILTPYGQHAIEQGQRKAQAIKPSVAKAPAAPVKRGRGRPPKSKAAQVGQTQQGEQGDGTKQDDSQ